MNNGALENKLNKYGIRLHRLGSNQSTPPPHELPSFPPPVQIEEDGGFQLKALLFLLPHKHGSKVRAEDKSTPD